MREYLKYDYKNTRITQEAFNPEYTQKTESMMAQGNGYLGLRAVDEEIDAFNNQDLFVNGVYNRDTEEEVPELANLADCIQTPIYLDGDRLILRIKDDYEKTIDLSTGILTRNLVVIRKTKKFKISFERFVAQNHNHIYGQKIWIQLLEGEAADVEIYPRINGRTTNHGTQHKAEGHKQRPTNNSIQYIEKTTHSKIEVFHNMVIRATKNGMSIDAGTDDYVVTMERRQVGFKIKTNLKENDQLEIEKLMSVNTSVDNAEENATENVCIVRGGMLHGQLMATSYGHQRDEAIDVFIKRMKMYQVEIIGTSKAAQSDRLALSFTAFHLNGFVPRENVSVSAAAKGLSGEGYQGHVFWDTDAFVLPNYFFVEPKIARNMLTYRYRGLQGARNKAMEKKTRHEESNIQGAQYPWETARPKDGEVCPYWGQADINTGKQEPVASRRQEIHVSADVALAVRQYHQSTNDDAFMKEMGYEIVIDTACYWARRAERQQNGKYMIKDVMGPNEYKGNVNNNAFTNAMAVKNIRWALEYIAFLKESEEGIKELNTIYSKIPYEVPEKLMADVVENMTLQVPNQYGVIPENDSFLYLPRNDIVGFKLLGDAGKKLFNTRAGNQLLGGQIIKQADVVLLTYNFPSDYTQDIVRKNFEYYEAITTHDSSLSPATHAIQAISLRQMALGRQLFEYALAIDMGPNMKSCDKGIHAGAIAANWQCIVFGYGGLKLMEGSLQIDPVLPAEWAGLNYVVHYKGSTIEVQVSKTNFKVRVLEGTDVGVRIDGKDVLVNSEEKKFSVRQNQKMLL